MSSSQRAAESNRRDARLASLNDAPVVRISKVNKSVRAKADRVAGRGFEASARGFLRRPRLCRAGRRSARPLERAGPLRARRDPWGSASRFHQRLDVTLDEDRSQVSTPNAAPPRPRSDCLISLPRILNRANNVPDDRNRTRLRIEYSATPTGPQTGWLDSVSDFQSHFLCRKYLIINCARSSVG